MLPTKFFIREQGENLTYVNKRGTVLPGNLNGEDVRQFYEEVVNTEFDKKEKPVPKVVKRKKVIKPKPTITANAKDIFKYAQDNDTAKILHLLQSGVDVNVRDTFGWTSLMCAACNGAQDVVEILIKFGADTRAKDPGYDALYLAQKNKHLGIVKLLSNGRKTPPRQTSAPSTSKSPKETLTCDKCDLTYKSSRRRHEASTVHLLSKHAMKAKTFYGISETNKGFQMLMRNGWDREQGLGRDGSGRKFPVKAVEKKDRRGIGAPKVKPKPNPNDIGRPKDRAFERNFRLQFH